MRAILTFLIIAAWIATPCSSAERFTSERPTPLKQLEPDKDGGTIVRFAGSVQITGHFRIVHYRDNPDLPWQITFFPDAASAALLPHPVDEKAVSELDFSNRERAVAMLRYLVTIRRKWANGDTSMTGAASVTIRNYSTDVECDHRWYLAELVSVLKRGPVVARARKPDQGC